MNDLRELIEQTHKQNTTTRDAKETTMDQETLFTGSKWDILKLLEQKKMSPIELAKESNTSMANISQQLRFLEMGGIVKSERISNRDKGQPRILYSLAGNNVFLIMTAPGFVNKNNFELTNRKKALMKIWFYERKENQYFIEKAFQKIENKLSNIKSVSVDRSDFSNITLTVESNNSSLQKELTDLQLTNSEGIKKTVKFKVVKELSSKDPERYFQIYNA